MPYVAAGYVAFTSERPVGATPHRQRGPAGIVIENGITVVGAGRYLYADWVAPVPKT